MNGEQTLGENLADIGGLAISYQAFKNTTDGKSNRTINGLTSDKRFFLGYAQAWRIKTREEAMRNSPTLDTHSPDAVRVNQSLANLPAFYKSWNVKPGDRLYYDADKRVVVWLVL